MKTKLLALPILVLLSTMSTGCIIVDDDDDDFDSTLTIANESSFLITELYIAEINSPFVDEFLGGFPLRPGQEIIIELDCGIYDVQIVDDTNLVCELRDLDLCFDDAVWVIDNLELDICEFGLTSSGSKVTKKPKADAKSAAERTSTL